MSDASETTDDNAEAPSPEPAANDAAKKRLPLSAQIGFGVVVAGVIIAAPWIRDQLAPPPIYVQEPGHEFTGHKYLYDEQLGWRNIPDWSATTMGQKLTINSLGMRDIEYERAKPAGVTRILVVGGSFTWGYGVADGENYTDVLEQVLTKSSDRKYEVLNSGVSGWGTDQEYLFLKNEGFDYEPDIVIAALNFTDQPVYTVSSVQFGLAKPLFLNTKLELGNVPVPKPGTEYPRLKSEAGEFELAVALLNQMARDCAERGCRFVVLKFGGFFYRHHPKVAGNAGVQRRLTIRDRQFQDALANRKSIHLLDLDAEFERRGFALTELTHGNHDGHWNPFGHREVGNILHAFLIEQGLVEGQVDSTALN